MKVCDKLTMTPRCLTGLIAGILVLFVCTGGAGAAGWLHFGCDNQFTGCNPAETVITKANVNQLTRKWGISCDDGYFILISGAPAVWNSTLYTSGFAENLKAYNAKTGQMLWSYGDGNQADAPQPTVSDTGTVYYLEGSGITYSLFSVNGTTGVENWEAPLQFELGYNDTAVVTIDESRNLVFLLCVPFMPDEGKLFAFDADTGNVAWYMSQPIDGVSFDGDYLLQSGGKIYVQVKVEDSHYTEQRIGVVDVATHTLETTWDNPFGTDLIDISKITFCGDKVAVTYCDRDDVFESDSTLVMYDLTGQILWQHPFGAAVTGCMAYNGQLDRIYVPTNPFLYAFDAVTGTETWKYTGFDTIFNPSIANGMIFFISDTNLYVLDESDRSLLFSFPLGYSGYENTRPAIWDGLVYFSGNGGTCDLFALGLPGECDSLGAAVSMPAHYFAPGDPCSCTVTLCNPNSATYSDVPLFVILDIMGNYYFAPGFSSFDRYTITLAPGTMDQIVLEPFNWPTGAGSFSSAIWYAAMTNTDMSELFGELGTWSFGWGE